MIWSIWHIVISNIPFYQRQFNMMFRCSSSWKRPWTIQNRNRIDAKLDPITCVIVTCCEVSRADFFHCVYSPRPDPNRSGFLLRGQTWRSASVSVNRGRGRTQEQHSKQQLLQRHWRLVGQTRRCCSVTQARWLFDRWRQRSAGKQRSSASWCEWTCCVQLKWSQTSSTSWISSLEQRRSAFLAHRCLSNLHLFLLCFLSWSIRRFFRCGKNLSIRWSLNFTLAMITSSVGFL